MLWKRSNCGESPGPGSWRHVSQMHLRPTSVTHFRAFVLMQNAEGFLLATTDRDARAVGNARRLSVDRNGHVASGTCEDRPYPAPCSAGEPFLATGHLCGPPALSSCRVELASLKNRQAAAHMPNSIQDMTAFASIIKNTCRASCFRGRRFPADKLISLEQGIASRIHDWHRSECPIPDRGDLPKPGFGGFFRSGRFRVALKAIDM